MGIQLLKILIATIILGFSFALIDSESNFLILLGMALDVLAILMLCADPHDKVIKSIFKKK